MEEIRGLETEAFRLRRVFTCDSEPNRKTQFIIDKREVPVEFLNLIKEEFKNCRTYAEISDIHTDDYFYLFRENTVCLGLFEDVNHLISMTNELIYKFIYKLKEDLCIRVLVMNDCVEFILCSKPEIEYVELIDYKSEEPTDKYYRYNFNEVDNYKSIIFRKL